MPSSHPPSSMSVDHPQDNDIQDDDNEALGRISNNDREAAECIELPENVKGATAAAKCQPLAIVRPTTLVPEFVPPAIQSGKAWVQHTHMGRRYGYWRPYLPQFLTVLAVLGLVLKGKPAGLWSSGKYEEPPRPYRDFSGDNWADSNKCDPAAYPANLPPFTTQGKKPTREIEHLVEKLNEQQWEKIIETALTFSKRSGKKSCLHDSSEGTVAENGDAKGAACEEESDFELEDDAMNVDQPAEAA
ncbi:hypothetical protein CPB84DRAFT_1754069 [Gymnopilus junonius]|uniref:Uncharacterized protein n=1 Tax=Gymnopilus junonius TaxID=109634 RepID=A0A9P5TFY1_GYMJU|nr:hypothetical protein CPB84DRAFT_1754069 [Gymnopilus junonius]